MEQNIVALTSVECRGNMITYHYETSGPWRACFLQKMPYIIEYPVDVSGVPESVAVVPFLCTILPAAWLYDAKILLRDCDADFFESILEFKKGYADMYPDLAFLGEVVPDKLTKNTPDVSRSAAFFSGGVDATFTLLSHFEEKPILITLWGADIRCENESGWEKASAYISATADAYGLSYCPVKTPFRQILNETPLSKLIKKTGEDWWHGFQHGIGIISHAAPLAFINGISRVYIGSSKNAQETEKTTTASYPTIDNNVRFCGCRVIHDGFAYTRQDKVRAICELSNTYKLQAPLRVCWISTGGSNCCICEKCARTILAIAAEGYDPIDFGFALDSRVKRKIKYLLLHKAILIPRRFEPIQQRLRLTMAQSPEPSEWAWFCDMSIEEMNRSLLKKIYASEPVRLVGRVRQHLGIE